MIESAHRLRVQDSLPHLSTPLVRIATMPCRRVRSIVVSLLSTAAEPLFLVSGSKNGLEAWSVNFAGRFLNSQSSTCRICLRRHTEAKVQTTCQNTFATLFKVADASYHRGDYDGRLAYELSVNGSSARYFGR